MRPAESHDDVRATSPPSACAGPGRGLRSDRGHNGLQHYCRARAPKRIGQRKLTAPSSGSLARIRKRPRHFAVIVRRRSFEYKPGYGIESAEFSAATLLQALAKAGPSGAERMCCGGSGTTYRKLDNARLVEREHRPGIGRQHLRSYPGPSFEQARPLANSSGEVPLQVELKTILQRNIWGHFRRANLHRECGRSIFRTALECQKRPRS